MTWFAAAAHEILQELADFGMFIHGGWSKRSALIFNVLSALTFLIGRLLTYTLSFEFDMSFLVPFAVGNFIYIGASDLVPEIKKHENLRTNIIHLLLLTDGIALMAANRVFLG
jgi:zinc and cadmium transporter